MLLGRAGFKRRHVTVRHSEETISGNILKRDVQDKSDTARNVITVVLCTLIHIILATRLLLILIRVYILLSNTRVRNLQSLNRGCSRRVTDHTGHPPLVNVF